MKPPAPGAGWTSGAAGVAQRRGERAKGGRPLGPLVNPVPLARFAGGEIGP